MSPVKVFVPGEIASFPRVSGDEPSPTMARTLVSVFSPRERG